MINKAYKYKALSIIILLMMMNKKGDYKKIIAFLQNIL